MALSADSTPPKLARLTKGLKPVIRAVNPIIDFCLWLSGQLKRQRVRAGIGIRLTEREDGIKIDCTATGDGGGGLFIILPWTPYPAPSGDALSFMVRAGGVLDNTGSFWEPDNVSAIISVPANCPAFFTWLKAKVDQRGSLLSLSYDWGTALPNATTLPDPSSTAPAPLLYYPLLTLSSTQAAVDLANVVHHITGTLQLLPTTTTGNQTAMLWYPASAITAEGILE